MVTVGNANAALHEFAGAVMVGEFGKITTFTVLLTTHAPVPAVPAAVVPHAEAKT